MNEQTIFLAALSQDDPAQRAAYLDQACAGNPELRSRIENLLAQDGADSQADTDLTGEDSLLDAGDDSPLDLPPESTGTAIGPYVLQEPLAQGGRGVVYRAEQEQPVRRSVVVKILIPRLKGEEVSARFEAERQALLRLDHPHIAPVHEVGATPSEHLYVVRELVEGTPLTDFCRQKRSSLTERLELMVMVCRAVQHAHHKGLIHRRLRPSNVLVALRQDQPIVRVVDFDLTGALDQKLSERFTQARSTLEPASLVYLAPEQVQECGSDVDTRVDVYALGMLLYELLIGTSPMESQAGTEEVLRWITQESLPLPSVRVRERAAQGTSDDQPAAILTWLADELHGTLDGIVRKALARESAQRYETPAALAQAIERYLHDPTMPQESVQQTMPAGIRPAPPVRRSRRLLANAAMAALVLVPAGIGSLWQAVHLLQVARGERDQARSTETEARARAEELARREENARAELKSLRHLCQGLETQVMQARDARQRLDQELRMAQSEAATDRAVTDFLASDLLSPSDVPRLDRDVKLRTLLDQAAARIAGRLHEQPLAEAAGHQRLGMAYAALGMNAAARVQLEEGLALTTSQLGAAHPQALWARTRVIDLDLAEGRAEQAEAALLEVLRDARGRLGPDHALTLQTMTRLADLYQEQGKLAEAETLLSRVVQTCRRTQGEGSVDFLTAQDRLASVYRAQKKYPQAEKMWKQLVETSRRTLGPDHACTLTVMYNLAQLYQKLGQPEEAEAVLSRMVERGRDVLQLDHPRLFPALTTLAHLYEARGQHQRAEGLLLSGYREVQKRLREGLLPESRVQLVQIHQRLAGLYEAWGKKEQASVWRERLSALHAQSEPARLGVPVGSSEAAEPSSSDLEKDPSSPVDP